MQASFSQANEVFYRFHITTHDVNLHTITKAEIILLCGKNRILSFAIQSVTVIHNFPLICIGGGGVIL